MANESAKDGVRLALVLGGGAARGLAHIGVLEVLEREGIRPDFLVGSSMGGLVAALSATGLRSQEIEHAARSFRFPRWFLPGAFVRWASIFPAAARILESKEFGELDTPLAIAAVELESGRQTVLHEGAVLPAVMATCAVPGVLPPVKVGGQWLVDGGLVNVLPVDVAWMADPDVVVAVKVQAARARGVPRLGRLSTRILSRVGMWVPNPASAKVALELLVRAAEIALDRQGTLAAAMAGPEVLVEVDVGDIRLREFHRLEEAVEAGRRAAQAALPEVRRALGRGGPPEQRARGELLLRFDPVCNMVVSPRRSRGSCTHGGVTFHFCSVNCLEAFSREPVRYLRGRLALDRVKTCSPG